MRIFQNLLSLSTLVLIGLSSWEIYLASLVRNLIETSKRNTTKKSDPCVLKLKCYCGFFRQVEYTTGPYIRRCLWSNHEGACQGDSKKPLRNSVHWRGRVRYHCWIKPYTSNSGNDPNWKTWTKIHFAKCRPLLEVTCISLEAFNWTVTY